MDCVAGEPLCLPCSAFRQAFVFCSLGPRRGAGEDDDVQEAFADKMQKFSEKFGERMAMEQCVPTTERPDLDGWPACGDSV